MTFGASLIIGVALMWMFAGCVLGCTLFFETRKWGGEFGAAVGTTVFIILAGLVLMTLGK